MEEDRIIKQLTITENDIVELVRSELYNSGLLEGMDIEDIKRLDEMASFELIQNHCDNNIETVLSGFKTGLNDMELEEFEYWFGFNSDDYLEELKGLLK